MIDFHTHILPGIDDGSQSIEETRKLLWQAKEQGVARILASPHFYADKQSAERFFSKREEGLRKVRDLAQSESWIPEIKAAAEVYYFNGIGNASVLPRLCMEGSSVILLELPFVQWTSAIYRDIETIIKKQELTVILAHIERYYEFQRDKSIWNAVFELPLYPQINAGSFLRMRTRSFVLKFLKTGHEVLLGSDCHNPVHRPANLGAARDVIARKLGAGVLHEIDDRGKELWERAQ